MHELVAPGQGGKTHGVVLGSCEHMGNDEWSPSWAVPLVMVVKFWPFRRSPKKKQGHLNFQRHSVLHR